MILNYLKVAFRLLIRNPFFSLINIVGLSVGFAVFFILWPYSQSQLKSDEFIKDHEQIVRLLTDFRWTDDDGENWGKLTLAATLGCFGPELMKASEDLSDITRFMSSGSVDSGPVGLDGDIIVAVGNNASDLKLFKERNVIRADANFVTFLVYQS